MKSQVASLLFISGKPQTAKSLFAVIKNHDSKATLQDVALALVSLQEEYNQDKKGINIIESAGTYQFVTSQENAGLIKKFLKDEKTGELSQPSLETLTIVAYRGPISKPHIEQIRGVNCSIILRNLLIRGLVEVDDTRVETFYRVTTDFLKFLGVTSVDQLPNYDKLHSVENLEEFLGAEPENI